MSDWKLRPTLSVAMARVGEALVRATRRLPLGRSLPVGPARAVVMVAYWFPPHTEVGAARPHRFMRYLRQSGTAVSIVCSSDMLRRTTDLEALSQLHEDEALQRVPDCVQGWRERAVARGLQGLQRVLPNNDRLSWLPSGYRAARRVITGRSVLLSTHPPVVTHLTALALKLRFGRPWVADFRDPLLRNSSRTSRRAGWVDIVIEGLVLGAADAVIANTEGAAEVLRRRYPAMAAKVRTIWNGFDPEDEVPEPTPRAGGRCRITHTGTLYADRTLLPVARCLARLIGAGTLPPAAVELRQIGRVDPECFDPGHPDVFLLASAGCLYRSPRQLPIAEARREMAEADILLLLDVNRSGPELQVPAKTFDYVRSGKPILAFTSPGSATEHVLRLAAVPHLCVDVSQDPQVVDEAVLGFISERHAPAAPSARFLAEFSAPEQTRALLQILDAVQEGAATASVEPAKRRRPTAARPSVQG